MNIDEVLDLDLTATAALLASGRITSRELVDAALARLDLWQARINCFISVEADTARKGADACDRLFRKGRPRPLHGLPMAHKDMFWRAGKRPTYGSHVDTGYTPACSATTIERLEKAGSVTLGTLNMAEFAFGPIGHNLRFGDCLNPYDLQRIPGGSSSGSAAAVGAGVVYAALGSDTGGSIRTPASLCNIVGFKPTHGTISRFGMMPLAPSFDSVGIATRSVRDCALLYDILRGPDPHDRSAVERRPGSVLPAQGRSMREIRIGIPGKWFDDEIEPECAAVFENALACLKEMGFSLHAADAALTVEVMDAMRPILLAEAAATHAPYFSTQASRYCGLARARIEEGLKVGQSHYEAALANRPDLTGRYMETVFAGVDIVVTPTMTQNAPFVSAGDVRATSSEPFSRSLSTTTRPVNFLGLPAVSVPAGFAPDGLPIGLQFIARPFEETILFQVAQAFETATNWSSHRPSQKGVA